MKCFTFIQNVVNLQREVKICFLPIFFIALPVSKKALG